MRKYSTWVYVVVIIGIIYLAANIAKLIFPALATVLWFFIILWGLSMLTGRHRRNDFNGHTRKMVFSNGEVKINNLEDRYTVSFSNGVVDLTDPGMNFFDRKIQIEVSFSNCEIKVNPETPVVISARQSFSDVHLPDGTAAHFGECTYATQSYRQNEPYLQLFVKTSFSHVEIVERKSYF